MLKSAKCVTCESLQPSVQLALPNEVVDELPHEACLAYNGCELTDFCCFEELNIVLVSLFQSIEIVVFLV